MECKRVESISIDEVDVMQGIWGNMVGFSFIDSLSLWQPHYAYDSLWGLWQATYSLCTAFS